MAKTLVVKVGGAILGDINALKALFNVVTDLQSNYQRGVIVVHGGGMVVDKMLSDSGHKTEKLNGLRKTPSSQIPIICGALAGTVNKQIVSVAQTVGISAVGMSLADGNMITCTKASAELGEVGIPHPENNTLLSLLLKASFTPVISSIGRLQGGSLVNVNADDAAVAITQLLDAELVLLTDVSGVQDDCGETINQLTEQYSSELIKSGVIAGGMAAKVNAAFHAANQLRRSIAIASWKQPEQIKDLALGIKTGTRILPN